MRGVVPAAMIVHKKTLSISRDDELYGKGFQPRRSYQSLNSALARDSLERLSDPQEIFLESLLLTPRCFILWYRDVCLHFSLCLSTPRLCRVSSPPTLVPAMDPFQRIPTLHEIRLAARVKRARALFGPGGYLLAGGQSSRKADTSEPRIPEGRMGEATGSQACTPHEIEGSSVPGDKRYMQETPPVEGELELGPYADDHEHAVEKEAATKPDTAQRPSSSPAREHKQRSSQGTSLTAPIETRETQQRQEEQCGRATPKMSAVGTVVEQRQLERRSVRMSRSSLDDSATDPKAERQDQSASNKTTDAAAWNQVPIDQTPPFAANSNGKADRGAEFKTSSALLNKKETRKGFLTTVTFTIVGGRPGRQAFNKLQQKGKVTN